VVTAAAAAVAVAAAAVAVVTAVAAVAVAATKQLPENFSKSKKDLRVLFCCLSRQFRCK
jgi:hypothetical protein